MVLKAALIGHLNSEYPLSVYMLKQWIVLKAHADWLLKLRKSHGKVIWYYQLCFVDNVNWSLLRVSKLTFRALALRQSK